MNEVEQVIMELIIHAGNARSLAIEAISKAREDSFEEADSLMKQADEEMITAHKAQSQLLCNETNGSQVPLTLLMVHAQDHVMNAITVKDLANEIIANMKKERKEN